MYVGGRNDETYESFICKSTDYGKTWTKVFYQETIVYSIAVNPIKNNTLFASTGLKTFTSENGGGSWNSVTHLNMTDVTALQYTADGKLFAARENGVEWFDSEWKSLSSDLTFTVNWSSIDFDAINDILYIGTSGGVIKLDVGVVTSVEDEQAVDVSDFELNGNYPNPFNSSTAIMFELPVSGHIKIDVYNTAGQKIRTLENANFNGGSHQTYWDGRNDHGNTVASGIYFYRLTAESNKGRSHQTKKMLLVK